MRLLLIYVYGRVKDVVNRNAELEILCKDVLWLWYYNSWLSILCAAGARPHIDLVWSSMVVEVHTVK